MFDNVGSKLQTVTKVIFGILATIEGIASFFVFIIAFEEEEMWILFFTLIIGIILQYLFTLFLVGQGKVVEHSEMAMDWLIKNQMVAPATMPNQMAQNCNNMSHPNLTANQLTSAILESSPHTTDEKAQSVEKLAQLTTLHENGLLTDEEYEVERQKVISTIF